MSKHVGEVGKRYRLWLKLISADKTSTENNRSTKVYRLCDEFGNLYSTRMLPSPLAAEALSWELGENRQDVYLDIEAVISSHLTLPSADGHSTEAVTRIGFVRMHQG